MNFRKLRAEEIEVRVGGVYENGCTLLLYKDARCDMRVLDTSVGAEHWQRDHKEVKGNLFCGVGIEVSPDKWVWKWDCGTESNTEKEKGESSDSFKRACFNWGIGRELYTTPFIWVTCETKNGKLTDEAKKMLKGMYVQRIEYDGERISHVIVMNRKNEIIFRWSDNVETNRTQDGLLAPISEREKNNLLNICKKRGIDVIYLLNTCGWESGEITQAQYGEALRRAEGLKL